MDLKDRVALVAGGTGVLGIAIARALAKAGAHVAITYLERKDAARETCAAVEALGRKAWSVALDQTDASAIPATIEAAVGQFGRLDMLVNNAAWNVSIPFPAWRRSTPRPGTGSSPPISAGRTCCAGPPRRI